MRFDSNLGLEEMSTRQQTRAVFHIGLVARVPWWKAIIIRGAGTWSNLLSAWRKFLCRIRWAR